MKTIDNSAEIRKHLSFESEFDRYIVHIIKRAKDDNGRKYGVNETNRLVKTFYITSLEYFDRKLPVIRDLCDSNGARAYILPQVRDNSACLKELLKIVVDSLDNPTVKPDHLIRSAYCGYHGSRDKKWILDLDSDEMTETWEETGFPRPLTRTREWTPGAVLDFVKKQLADIGKPETDCWMIPTRNGHCLVTSPFNLQKASRECRKMFQGEHGWLIKDGMALLYFKTAD